jgi:multidrug transporter EmrE-like cation transporter
MIPVGGTRPRTSIGWSWLSLFATIALNCAANIMLREISAEIGMTTALFSSWPFLLAAGTMGLAFVFYVVALSRLSLSVAYPTLVGSTMIVIALASYLRLDTPLTPSQFAGTILVLIGVVLVSATSGDKPHPTGA